LSVPDGSICLDAKIKAKANGELWITTEGLPNASAATVTDTANITLHPPTVANPNLVAQSIQSVEEERLPLSAMVVILEFELQLSLSSIFRLVSSYFSFHHSAFFFLISFTFV
jgi:hypothetical protein